MAAPKVIIAIAAVLLFAHVQCVGACLAVVPGSELSGAGSVPLCHKHQNNSESGHNPDCCSRGVVVAPAISPAAPQSGMPVVVLGWAAQSAAIVPPDEQCLGFSSFDSSPPLVIQSFTVLRV